MKILFLIGCFAMYLTSVNALQCWHCENQGSLEDCSINGELKQCQPNQHACETVERRRNGDKSTYFKHCKQREACANSHLQNARRSPTPRQCQGKGPSSVCYCCCYQDGCGQGTNDCKEPRMSTGEIPSTGTTPPEPVCDDPPVWESGEVECDSSLPNGLFSLGTKCYYMCNEGTSFPVGQADTTVCERADPTNPLSSETVWFPPPPEECIGDLGMRCERPPFWEEGFSPVGTVTCDPQLPGGGWALGSTCKYACPEEHALVGSDTALCDFLLHPETSQLIQAFSPTHPCCEPPCHQPSADFVFVLEQSNSIGSESWPTVTGFVADAMRHLRSNPNVRIGVAIFGSGADEEMSFPPSENTEQLEKKVETLPFKPNAQANTIAGLFNALALFDEDRRTEASRYIVVITSGQYVDPNGEDDLLGIAAGGAHSRTQGVFAFGVNVPKYSTDLDDIASAPFYVTRSLENDSDYFGSIYLLKSLTEVFCDPICNGFHMDVPF